jgi:hypothetical protein
MGLVNVDSLFRTLYVTLFLDAIQAASAIRLLSLACSIELRCLIIIRINQFT